MSAVHLSEYNAGETSQRQVKKLTVICSSCHEFHFPIVFDNFLVRVQFSFEIWLVNNVIVRLY